MFERFSDSARRTVVYAQEEARRLKHDTIGTEHLLLGLLREGEGIAARALQSAGVTLEAARTHVLEKVGRGVQDPSGSVPLTPRAKMVVGIADQEALELGHNHIETEDLLLGLLREGRGVAVQVLTQLDVDLTALRDQVIDRMKRTEADAGSDDLRRIEEKIDRLTAQVAELATLFDPPRAPPRH